jgi:C4-dicarboxylate transporter DctM subunit
MPSEIIGLIGIALMVFLFMLGMPVAFTMAFTGLAGLAYLIGPEPALVLMAQDFFETLSSYPLSVITMFILMGSFAFATGLSKRLYQTSYSWFGAMPGGLTVATVIACSGFAAICGSTTATAATMGKIALPEMKKYHYADILATGTIAAAGTLGILIPPSTILLIYGILTEQSIGKLFIAGVLPGLLLCVAFVLTVLFLCLRKPGLGPAGPKTTLAAKIRSITGIIEAVILFALTIGGLFLGWFSPTQAGAIGAGGALLIGIFRGHLTLKSFFESSLDGLRTSCMVLMIITGATVFGHFMAMSGLPASLADWVGGLPIPPYGILVLIVIIYFVGGFFMDSMPLIIVTIPIFYPLILKMGFDPIWFGVIIVLVGEMGVITPPVGVNVFVINAIAPDVSLNTIFRGIVPFLISLIIVTALVIIFPQIATFLPSFISY